MMKPFLSTLATALLLTACIDVPVPTEEVVPQKTPSIPVLSAEQILKENTPETLQYKPIANTKTRFYDPQGRLTDKAVKGGFYRQVLGRTPSEQLVLQDFYQDSEKPYTLPFVAVKEAQLKIFNGAEVRDGRTVWLKPDGTVLRVADFKNGKAVGEMWFFERNKPVAYIKLLPKTPKKSVENATASAVASASDVPKADKSAKKFNKKPIKPIKPTAPVAVAQDDIPENVMAKGSALMRFFYPSGRLLAEIETDGNQQNTVMLYYPNGSSMLQIEDDGTQSSRTAWDNQGQKIAPSEVLMDADMLILRIQYGLNLMGRNQGALAELLANI